MNSYTTELTQNLSGTIRVASDKSLSHRSLIFSALAEGPSQISGLLPGEDVKCTLEILNKLGVKTSHQPSELTEKTELTIHGVGLRGFKAPSPETILYCGNSGTTMRLMLGLLSAQNFSSTLTGDDSLNKRPMERVFQPLRQMGADFQIEEKNGQRLIHVKPGKAVKGIHYDSPVASAQVKTAILLAGLHSAEEIQVTEPALSRNHTELLLSSMGAKISTKNTTICLKPGEKLSPLHHQVPADISSAAFFIVAALITPNSHLLLKDVNLNPTRTGIIEALQEMGAQIEIQNQQTVAGEPCGDLLVKHSNLKGTSIAGDLIPRLIDEIPILALAGAFAEGKLIIQDAKELRVKETDRIGAICQELSKLGINTEEQESGFTVIGQGPQLKSLIPKNSQMKSYGDHRMAMMEAVAGLRSEKALTIDDINCVSTSFPNFFQLLDQIKKGSTT